VRQLAAALPAFTPPPGSQLRGDRIASRKSGGKPPHSKGGASNRLIRLISAFRTVSSPMPDWPHSPLHRVEGAGAYIVTAGTYRKESFFRSKSRLTLLCRALLELSRKHSCGLQAWAVFPNHYHLVGVPPSGNALREFVRHLHSTTARLLNQLDRVPTRKVWFQYWETRLTFQRSYLARLHYVHQNAVHHKLVKRASNYPWCSAGWFERKASPAFQKTVYAFPCDRISVPDPFEVSIEEVSAD
jgi:putative transposase